jgi:hypothetical protein
MLTRVVTKMSRFRMSEPILLRAIEEVLNWDEDLSRQFAVLLSWTRLPRS